MKNKKLPEIGTVSSMDINSTEIEFSQDSSTNKFNVQDIPGHLFHRTSYYNQLGQSRLIILVIDSSQNQSIQNAADIVYMTLISKNYKQQPLLVLCNKQDLENAKSSIQVEQQLMFEIDKIKMSRKTMDHEDDDFDDFLKYESEKFEFQRHNVKFCAGSLIKTECQEFDLLLQTELNR